ncbi:MAG: putative membrane protein [Halieaceae bacterium]|jgi:uncharacterized membrane protein
MNTRGTTANVRSYRLTNIDIVHGLVIVIMARDYSLLCTGLRIPFWHLCGAHGAEIVQK